MSQKISPVSVRLKKYRGFDHNVYVDQQYAELWHSNITMSSLSTKIFSIYGILKPRYAQTNRRLRLKHQMPKTQMHKICRVRLSNLPYKTKLNCWSFQKPLYGVQYTYSARPVQGRKKLVNIKK